MPDAFLLTINQWMSAGIGLAILGSFLWGLVSILFSPCHLASIPLMVGYVAGQDDLSKRASIFALLFSFGLFLSIALVGFACSLLGRMLGDISPFWGIPIGLLIFWLGLDMFGLSGCRVPSLGVGNFKMRGYQGAFILGLMYGILSGACTFGFIAPILAVITMQKQILTGLILIIFFALGHCLPIMLAGSSVNFTQKLLQNKGFASLNTWGRKLAAVLVCGVALYIIVNPFL